MSAEHLIYSKQSAFGTWVTPAKALPVVTADLQSGREVKSMETTGAGRAPYLHVLGAKPVTLATELPWWTVNTATLLNQLLTTIATTNPNAGVYDHALLFDDTTTLGSISAQVKHNATVGRNALGCVVNGLTISAATKEAARLSFDYLCKDEAKVGGVWDYDGTTSSAAIVASPSYATLRRPFMFYDAAIVAGGTPSLASSKLSVSGGTSYTKLLNAEIKIATNLDGDGYGLSTDPTVQELYPGNRAIELTFEMSWTDYSLTFYDNARAGTAMAFDMALSGPVITGAFKYEAHVCLPSVFFDPVNLPAIGGDKKRRTVQVKGTAQTDTTTGVDMGLWIRTSESTL